MPRAAARFTQADVNRVIRGAAQARVPVAIDIKPDGTIRVLVNSGATERPAENNPPSLLPEQQEPEL